MVGAANEWWCGEAVQCANEKFSHFFLVAAGGAALILLCSFCSGGAGGVGTKQEHDPH